LADINTKDQAKIPGFAKGKEGKTKLPGFKFGSSGSYGNGYSPKSTGGGSRSTKDKVDEERTWDPDYDRFYNLLDDIKAQLREQEKLQRNLEDIKRNSEKTLNLNEARGLFDSQIKNYNDQAKA
jgi:hypothetical protein